MIEKHQTEMVDNFKRFLDEHGHKLVVTLNDEGTSYDASVPGLVCEHTFAVMEVVTRTVDVAISQLSGYQLTPEKAMFKLALACRGKILVDEASLKEYEVPDCFPDLISYSEPSQQPPRWGVV